MTYLSQPSAGADTAPFDTSDRGLLLGDGVFDTSLVLDGRIVFAEAHRKRLINDAAVLDIPVCTQALERAIASVLTPDASGALRVTVTRGAGGRGLHGDSETPPTLMARLSPLVPVRMFVPVNAAFTTIRRNETSPTASSKTLAYLDNILAVREVSRQGAEEALFLNTAGNLACGSSTNIFTVSGDVISTPRISDGALPGTMRAWVLENAAECGMEVVSSKLSQTNLNNADAAFVTNSLRLIAPIANIGDPSSRHITGLSRRLVTSLRNDGFSLPGEVTLP